MPGLFFFLLGAAVEHLIPGGESSTLWHYVELAAFALSYIFVGFSILREAVEGVLAKNIFNENLLMAVASLGAFAIGEYSEGLRRGTALYRGRIFAKPGGAKEPQIH